MIVHTAPRVKRVTRKGLDGKQEWREHRKTHATCSPSDGWYILVEHPNVVVIATTHYDADDCYEPDSSVTYTVVDRSKTYKATTSLKYALEVFMFACVNELLYRLRRLPESIGSQRLTRLARFVQKEKRSAKWQEGRTEQDDELDNVPDSYSLSAWEEWNQ